MGARRFFWNIKESFIGVEFLKYAPIKAAMLPTLVIVPTYLFLTGQKGNLTGNVYYDLYDSDVTEQ